MVFQAMSNDPLRWYVMRVMSLAGLGQQLLVARPKSHARRPGGDRDAVSGSRKLFQPMQRKRRRVPNDAEGGKML